MEPMRVPSFGKIWIRRDGNWEWRISMVMGATMWSQRFQITHKAVLMFSCNNRMERSRRRNNMS